MSAADGAKLNQIVIDHVGHDLGFSDERRNVLAAEFQVNNLHFTSLFNKTIRRSYRFFAAVVLLELFAVLPRHVTAPVAGDFYASIDAAHNLSVVVAPAWVAWVRMPLLAELALDAEARRAHVDNLELQLANSSRLCPSLLR